jgi:hypothetical protein
LLTAGLDAATDQLRNWPPETGLLDFLTHSCRPGDCRPPTRRCST